jgi:hypothetical protein
VLVNIEMCMWIRERVFLQKLEVHLILNSITLMIVQMVQIVKIILQETKLI